MNQRVGWIKKSVICLVVSIIEWGNAGEGQNQYIGVITESSFIHCEVGNGGKLQNHCMFPVSDKIDVVFYVEF